MHNTLPHSSRIKFIGMGVGLLLVPVIVLLLRNPRDGDTSDAGTTATAVGPEIIIDPIPANPQEIGDATTHPGWKRYASARHEFAVEYPGEFSVTSYDEGGPAETIVFQSGGRGLQVLVSGYAEKQPLTVEGIRTLQPLTEIDDPQEVMIGGVPAVLFWSTTSELGKTGEVWFVRGGRMYAVTARASDDALLSQIMATWKFGQ